MIYILLYLNLLLDTVL